MLDYEIAASFDKDLKVMQKRRKKMPLLRDIMRMIIQEKPLLAKHKNHPLHGKHKGKWECHVEPNWVLIYRIDKPERKVVFYRTGSHSDLF